MNKNEISKSYSKALELHNKILVSAQLAQNNFPVLNNERRK